METIDRSDWQQIDDAVARLETLWREREEVDLASVFRLWITHSTSRSWSP